MNRVEELEKAVLMLEEQVEQNKTTSAEYLEDLARAKKELADINKPVLTPSQLDDIQEAIEAGIENFDFSDSDNYNIEYGIDYDGRVNCESLELCNHGDLVELIVKEVHELFVETEDDITEANSSFGND
tara:strand:+ start:19 stop:405 length:387 start_codon:yes stop_codon:yes gene_type:complete